MDQEVCYQLTDFDPDSVDVSRPAATVHEYLQQVFVNRVNCPDVVTASIDPSCIKNPGPQVLVPPIASAVCHLAPDALWQRGLIQRFSASRSKLDEQRLCVPKLEPSKLPEKGNAALWKKVCFASRLPGIPIAAEHLALFEHHKGTPPTTRFLLSLSDAQVDKLIEYFVNIFLEEGYSRALFEWMFALLLTVKTPLQFDVVSSLRSFARKCRSARVTLGEDDLDLIREYTVFIAIVSLFFLQKDLAD